MTAPVIAERLDAPASIVPGRPAERAFARYLAGLNGHVVLPGFPTWDQARRSWNLRYDPQPLAVVRAADARDVAATVRFAREHDVPLTVRSGGHSLAGYSGADGALLLDLGNLRSLDIDPAARIAIAGPGLRAGEYSAAAVAHGLGTSFGDTGTVGLGGLITGGGIGWLARAYGMTIDSLVSADIVTADGEIRTVDATHEPELFWGIRGGGGNFGIATSFTLRLHPVDRFLGGAIALPATVDVVRRGHRGRRRCARRPHPHPGPHAHPAAAVRAGPVPRHPVAGRAHRVGRRSRGRPTGPGPHPGHRAGHGRHGRADALPGHLQPDRGGGQAHHRRLALGVPRRHRRRGHRGPHRGHRDLDRRDDPHPAARPGWRDGAGPVRRHRVRAPLRAAHGRHHRRVGTPASCP